jgi:hypothetical protein
MKKIESRRGIPFGPHLQAGVHRRAGIELLGDRDETYLMFLEDAQHAGEVQQRSAKAVDFIYYDAIRRDRESWQDPPLPEWWRA